MTAITDTRSTEDEQERHREAVVTAEIIWTITHNQNHLAVSLATRRKCFNTWILICRRSADQLSHICNGICLAPCPSAEYAASVSIHVCSQQQACSTTCDYPVLHRWGAPCCNLPELSLCGGLWQWHLPSSRAFLTSLCRYSLQLSSKV